MSGYTDMLVSVKTRDRLKAFAVNNGLNIAQLLEYICDLLEKNESDKSKNDNRKA